MEVTEAGLAQVFSTVLPLLDERQRRALVGAHAQALGRGGIAAVARASGMSRTTVSKAVAEVGGEVEVVSQARVRREGAGRKRLVDTDPELLADLDGLVEPATRGDPMCPLRWTSKSTGNLAGALAAMGHEVSADTVGRLLKEAGYSLQATRKTREGKDHPDRDQQFVYLSQQVAEHLAAGQPVISVDAKKKELVGRKANGGREWQPKGSPVEVDTHDFPDPPTRRSARRSPTGSTTSQPTRPGSRWATTATPQASRWQPSGAGGNRWAHSPIRMRPGC